MTEEELQTARDGAEHLQTSQASRRLTALSSAAPKELASHVQVRLISSRSFFEVQVLPCFVFSCGDLCLVPFSHTRKKQRVLFPCVLSGVAAGLPCPEGQTDLDQAHVLGDGTAARAVQRPRRPSKARHPGLLQARP